MDLERTREAVFSNRLATSSDTSKLTDSPFLPIVDIWAPPLIRDKNRCDGQMVPFGNPF